MKRKKHFINGIAFYQEELTLAQDLKLLELFEGVTLEGVISEGVTGALRYLINNRLLDEFMDILLRDPNGNPPGDRVDWMQGKNSEILEVIEGFFFLNRKAADSLKSFSLGVDLRDRLMSFLASWIKSQRKTPPPSMNQKQSTESNASS